MRSILAIAALLVLFFGCVGQTAPSATENQTEVVQNATVQQANHTANLTNASKPAVQVNYTDGLLNAVLNDNITLAESMIKNGADVNVKFFNDTMLATVLESRGNPDMANLLIENGADVNFKDSYNRTALITALRINYNETAKLAIEHGADLNAKDNDGSSALILALQNKNYEIARLLINKGADVNVKFNSYAFDGRELTTLMAALVYAPSDIARLMVSKGANVSAMDSQGLDAVPYAESYKSDDKDLINFLKGQEQNATTNASSADDTSNMPTRCMDYDPNVVSSGTMTVNGVTYKIVMCQSNQVCDIDTGQCK
ncbi:MAG: ankyrin repeat domain-containing protein [Candidatus Micrarchaeota archaeon]|nr:ankyrin repeat domain-containing protein [Candidatus Micrarchaeota archaeon]